MTRQEIEQLIDRIQYKPGWQFKVAETGGEVYLQVRFTDHGGTEWGCRKWLISSHAVKSEVIQTALLAVLTAEEHEAREHFRYCGVSVFGPHFDVDAIRDVIEERRA